MYKRALGSRPYRNYTQESLEEAVRAIKSNKLSYHKAAQKFGIPKNTLLMKVKHTRSVGRQTIFTEAEEETFVAHAIAMSTFGFPVSTFDLRCVAKMYLNRVGRKEQRFTNNFSGIDWAEKFMKRHNGVITQRTAQNITYCRAANDEEVINSFF